MLFYYEALTKEGEVQNGSIDAINENSAVTSLQQRGLTIVSIRTSDERSIFKRQLFLSKKVPVRELVIFSRQIATLFSARVPVIRAFQMLTEEMDNPLMRQTLAEVTGDVQGGMQIADALEKHPLIFSVFYINMVRIGEESGKLPNTFEHLAEYLHRSYEVSIKARNALIYPAFVFAVFSIVMILLLTVIFPKLIVVLEDIGQELPIYTKIIIAISDLLVNFGVYLLVLLLGGGFWFFQFTKTDAGKHVSSRIRLGIPVLGELARKLYLSRIADSMYTLLTSGVSLVRTLEVTGKVVGDVTYEKILQETVHDVKSGGFASESFSKHGEIPGIMIQIMKAGEETGELGNILKTLSEFYRREVDNMVDALVGLIEPLLIVALGLGIGFVVGSVLVPIYSISTGF